jgi:hypothetical protein
LWQRLGLTVGDAWIVITASGLVAAIGSADDRPLMGLWCELGCAPMGGKWGKGIAMFVQVFQAKIRDADLWARQVERWRAEIRPKTTGFLGFTSGVTAAGDMITVVRFESEETARVDNDLPEQGAWFEETSKAFDGEATFHDCRDVDVLLDGGSDDAGFVQIMQGRAKDQEQMRGQEKAMEPELRKVRPDLMGGTMAWHGDGSFTQVAYFASEQEARKNEQAMATSPVSGQFMSLIDGALTFYDLTTPDFE